LIFLSDGLKTITGIFIVSDFQNSYKKSFRRRNRGSSAWRRRVLGMSRV
jgi:hypothetical protein